MAKLSVLVKFHLICVCNCWSCAEQIFRYTLANICTFCAQSIQHFHNQKWKQYKFITILIQQHSNQFHTYTPNYLIHAVEWHNIRMIIML